MRPQQNRRISNPRRNNGGAVRRAPNPLTRNYESSGPEVKIRGNAQHIAEKYLALARDAQAAGDRVMSENYLQHAEHYTRIILSAQSHEQNPRPERPEAEEPREEMAAQPMAAEADNEPINNDSEYDENAPQPVIDGVPGEVALIHRGSYKSADSDENEAPQPRRRRLPARRAAAPMRRRANEAEESNGAERPDYPSRAEPARAEANIRAESEDEAAPALRRRRAPAAAAANAEAAIAGADNAAAPAADEAPRPRLRRTRRAKSAEAEAEQTDNA